MTCQWNDVRWLAARTGPHMFVLLPPPEQAQTAISLSCLWTPADLVYPIGMASSAYVAARVLAARSFLSKTLPYQAMVQAAGFAMWAAFWREGAFLELAGTTKDPRAAELERRIVLSRFLARSNRYSMLTSLGYCVLTYTNSAGACPPQETGLLSNSW